MKKTRFSVLICLLLSFLIFSGCSESDADNDVSDPPEKSASAYEEELEYYAELVNSLQEQLLSEKEENYIAECEYKLEISKLQASIKMLEREIEYISASKESGITRLPGLTENTVTDKSPDNISSVSDFEYMEKSGEIIIIGYNGKEKTITIPSVIDGKPVTQIGEKAFSCIMAEKIILPESVKSIDWFAFSGCTVLKEIYIPLAVTKVGYGAFDNCPRDMVIICEKGSYIEAYAASWAIGVHLQ